MINAGDQREEAVALDDFAGGQRQRAHGASVKRAEKGDDVAAPGVPARHFDSRFDGFRARIGEENARVFLEGRNRRQFFRQLDLNFVIIIGSGNVDEFLRLLSDSLDHVRVTVPGRGGGDASSEVDVLIPIYVPDSRAQSMIDDERVPGNRRPGHQLVVARDNCLPKRAGTERSLGDHRGLQ